jgi:RNA polymerase sigma-70 factor (ECF subfamily)
VHVQECSDQEHLSRLAAGDMAHLEPLYQRWQRRVAAQCYAMVGDQQLAADLCHDVFLRVALYARTFRGEAAFGTWLYTMARRVCLDHIARRQRQRRVLEQVHREAPRAMHQTPHLQRLRAAFERLQPEQREILVLHRFHGWKLREIAEKMQATEGAIKVRAHRALLALRQEYHNVRSQDDA